MTGRQKSALFVILFFDRFLKLVCPFFNFGISVSNIDIHFCYVGNNGCAFGAITNFYALIFIRLLICFLCVFKFFVSKNSIGFSQILVGAISNTLDFFVFGEVIDCFFIGFLGFGFIFNIADLIILIGTLKILSIF